MRCWPVAVLGVALGVAGCSEGSSAPPPSTPYTGPAGELAPSQRSLPTFPQPTLPDRCELGLIEVAAAAGDPLTADVVVTFRNTAGLECEVDLDLAWATEHEIEPSVRLAPGATAELWGLAAASCDATTRAWRLTVNDEETTVELPAPSCEPSPVAFFPA